MRYDGQTLFKVSIKEDGVTSIPYEVGKITELIKNARNENINHEAENDDQRED